MLQTANQIMSNLKITQHQTTQLSQTVCKLQVQETSKYNSETWLYQVSFKLQIIWNLIIWMRLFLQHSTVDENRNIHAETASETGFHAENLHFSLVWQCTKKSLVKSYNLSLPADLSDMKAPFLLH